MKEVVVGRDPAGAPHGGRFEEGLVLVLSDSCEGGFEGSLLVELSDSFVEGPAVRSAAGIVVPPRGL